MTTKNTKAAKTSKKATTIHIATPGKGTPICGASGKGIKTTLTAAEATCTDCQKVAAHADEKAKNEAKATESKKAEKPETKKVAKPVVEPRARDPRLPPPGTVLKKLDRAGAVRCECKVTEAGFIYKGEEFRSLSAAAMAAAKDLGVSGAVNGYLWWGIIRQQPKVTDPLEALNAAWERFRDRVKVIAGGELEGATKTKVSNALDRQGREILEVASTL
ncbi:MAG: DUF2924 domain-containing protein [Myxococcales bacterium]